MISKMERKIDITNGENRLSITYDEHMPNRMGFISWWGATMSTAILTPECAKELMDVLANFIRLSDPAYKQKQLVPTEDRGIDLD